MHHTGQNDTEIKKKRALCVHRKAVGAEETALNSLHDKEDKNGGGGGNRTRVRK